MGERRNAMNAALLAGCTLLWVLLWMQEAAAYTFVPYSNPVYNNSVGVFVVPGQTKPIYSYDGPHAEVSYPDDIALPPSSGSWVSNGRGSSYTISNDVLVDQDGTRHSRVDVFLDGFTKGNLVGPGFIFTTSSSLAEYWLMPEGGTGQVQVTPTLTVHDAGKPYPSSPSYGFSIYDSVGNVLFEWKEDGLLSPFLLTLGEPFRILAGSGINTTGTAIGSFDYESAVTFSLDVVQMPDLIPVPLPSSLLFLLSGLLAVGCGRGKLRREG